MQRNYEMTISGKISNLMDIFPKHVIGLHDFINVT